MVRFTGGLLLFSAVALAAPAERDQLAPSPQRILASSPHIEAAKPRKLQGKFLHITDVHPDPFYKVGTSPDGEHPCHAGNGSAGYYGAEKTECDSPYALINATFDWIRDNLRDEVDFVIWTGDSARHDNDEDLPRTDKQVIDQNDYVVQKFVEVFGKEDNINDTNPTNDFVVPIIPTFGNNDILPHNILEPGPNKWTRRYIDIWNRFVPQEQRHSFARGGWFYTEVIPNRLAVFSLNTLYFFDSNSAVDGCDLKSEPGYEHMEWLRIQLQFLRQRGMKAILTGHVPPARTETKQSWDETCYQKYTLWMRQYRDVVVGSIYGHMNIDHFLFQDTWDLNYKFHIDGVSRKDMGKKSSLSEHRRHGDFQIAAKTTYLNELRAEWASLPTPPKGLSYSDLHIVEDVQTKKKSKKQKRQEKFLKDIGGQWGERFSLTLVSPSVVPNYFPTLRIVEYNITGLETEHPATTLEGITAGAKDIDFKLDADADAKEVSELDDERESEDELHELKKRGKRKDKKKKKKKKKARKPPFPVPHPPSSTAEPGPAYSPQVFSLLSFTQYYANLTKIQGVVEPEAQVEREASAQIEAQGPKYNPFEYKVEYTTNNDGAYNLHDLTVRSWLDLAEKISRAEMKKQDLDTEEKEDSDEGEDDTGMETEKKKEKGSESPKNHLWRTFVKRAFVHTKQDDELDESFG